MRRDLSPSLVQVDLAGAELQGAASGTERHRAHAQHAPVEPGGLLHVGDGQHEVIQAGDRDRHC
jgi:hypothetical protein